MSNKHHEVARLAYELYEKRGGCPGYEFEDWIEAERLIFVQPILVIEIETETEAAPKSSKKKPALQIKKEKKPGKAAAKTAAKTPDKTTAKATAKTTTTKVTKKATAKKKP